MAAEEERGKLMRAWPGLWAAGAGQGGPATALLQSPVPGAPALGHLSCGAQGPGTREPSTGVRTSCRQARDGTWGPSPQPRPGTGCNPLGTAVGTLTPNQGCRGCSAGHRAGLARAPRDKHTRGRGAEINNGLGQGKPPSHSEMPRHHH